MTECAQRDAERPTEVKKNCWDVNQTWQQLRINLSFHLVGGFVEAYLFLILASRRREVIIYISFPQPGLSSVCVYMILSTFSVDLAYFHV